jgi:hypothetical protein
MPVFEAVVNSIQSIEEKGEGNTGKIILQIDRDKQSTLDLESKELPPIVGFTIPEGIFCRHLYVDCLKKEPVDEPMIPTK